VLRGVVVAGLGLDRSEKRATLWVSPWWWLASVGPDLRKQSWVSPEKVASRGSLLVVVVERKEKKKITTLCRSQLVVPGGGGGKKRKKKKLPRRANPSWWFQAVAAEKKKKKNFNTGLYKLLVGSGMLRKNFD
jgi:hypothetical protein